MSDTAVAVTPAAPPPPHPHFGFEGAEKKIEINFAPGVNLRSLTLDAINLMLDAAKCTIIHVERSKHFDAYVLSESSLFIYSSKILIKTCGTTSLLNCLPIMMEKTKELGAEPEFVQYSRTQFQYPDKQPMIHRSFDKEVEYLNTFFPNGGGHIFGAINGARWHLYTADLTPEDRVGIDREQTLEIVMTELDPEKMQQFYNGTCPQTRSFTISLPSTGPEATKLSGIDKLIPGSTIDDFLFEPCGYSCNGIKDDAYFTIHITPEPQCSYVSFETNVALESYGPLVQRVLDTFSPGRFTISLFVDDASLVPNSYMALFSMEYKGYTSKTCAFQQFDGPHNVSCAQYVSTARATPVPANMRKVPLSPITAQNQQSTSALGTAAASAVDLTTQPVVIAPADATALSPRAATASALSSPRSQSVMGMSKDGTEPDDEHREEPERPLREVAPLVTYGQARKLGFTGLLHIVVDAVSRHFRVHLVPRKDMVNPRGLIQDIVKHENPQEPFYLVDLNDIVHRFFTWCSTFPHITPYYTVKCNGHPGVLVALGSLGCGFMCSSFHEIQTLLTLGIDASRIVFANPWKQESHLRSATASKVTMMAFTDIAELQKIKRYAPAAKLLLHINGAYMPKKAGKRTTVVDHVTSPAVGATLDKVPKLLEEAKRLDLKVVGVCFDVGEICYEDGQFKRALKDAKSVFSLAKATLGNHLRILDIGGGFSDESSGERADKTIAPEERPLHFDELAERLKHLIPKYFSPKVRMFSRPARFFVTSSHLLAVSVIARRVVTTKASASPLDPIVLEPVLGSPSQKPSVMPESSAAGDSKPVASDGYLYYVNDGLYGSFNCMLYDQKKVVPLPVNDPENSNRYACTIFGPTCDGVDCIAERTVLPELRVGDWLYFKNMGAYASSSATSFNGFRPPSVRYMVCPDEPSP